MAIEAPGDKGWFEKDPARTLANASMKEPAEAWPFPKVSVIVLGSGCI